MTLFQFINESNRDLKSMIEFIKANIDNGSEKSIRKIFNELSLTKPDNIDEWFKNRGIEDAQDDIIGIFDSFGETDILYSIISGNTKLPDSSLFVGKNTNNVYDLFASTGVSRDCMQRLNNFRPAKNTVARGPYEILCDIFIDDVFYISKSSNAKKENKDSGSGDVLTKSGALEFKGSGARVKGMGILGTENIDNAFEKTLNKSPYKDRYDKSIIYRFTHKSKKSQDEESQEVTKSYFSCQDAIIHTLGALASCGYTNDEVIDIVVESLTSQFEKKTESDKKALRNFISSHPDTFWPSSLTYTKKVNKRGKELSTYNFDSYRFTDLYGVIDMYFYQSREEWPYMILFSKDNPGTYNVISGVDCKSFESIYRMIGNKFTFRGIPNGTGFSSAVYIYFGNEKPKK